MHSPLFLYFFFYRPVTQFFRKLDLCSLNSPFTGKSLGGLRHTFINIYRGAGGIGRRRKEKLTIVVSVTIRLFFYHISPQNQTLIIKKEKP